MSELLPTTLIVLLVSVLAGDGDEMVTFPTVDVDHPPFTTSVPSPLMESLMISLTLMVNVPAFFTVRPLENVFTHWSLATNV